MRRSATFPLLSRDSGAISSTLFRCPLKGIEPGKDALVLVSTMAVWPIVTGFRTFPTPSVSVSRFA